jgi:hypothetical protein
MCQKKLQRIVSVIGARDGRFRLAAMTLLAGLLAVGPAAGQTDLYSKRDRLAETMRATRAQLHDWQTSQEEARRAVRVGPWQRILVRAGEEAGVDRVPATAVSGGRQCVFTTIRAERPVTLTIELSHHEGFGGFAYRPPESAAGVKACDAIVWLNGRQVELHNRLEGYQRVHVGKRRGWHDAVLIDLAIPRGDNRLLVARDKGPRQGWFDTVGFTPNPAAVLWAMIENDFPRSANRLLDAVDSDWFDADHGWLAQTGSPVLERKLLDRLAGELGPAGLTLSHRGEDLARSGAAAGDVRWLDLCVTAAELQHGLRQADALRAAIQELMAAYPGRYPGQELLTRAGTIRQRLAALAAARLDPADPPAAKLMAEFEALRREALVAKNPLLAGKKLLMVKRYTYDSNHYYDEFIAGIRRFGGGFFVLSLADGTVAELAPALGEGIVDRYDLAYDARRIVFDYKPHKSGGFRIYEVAADGTKLRQLTRPPADEDARIAAYATFSRRDLESNPCLYGHWTDDMHPCYLPDGRIVFTSTRSEHGVLCGGHDLSATNLHCIDADGGHLRRLSQDALSEFCPTVMNDGRILYNRWEYVDKGAGTVQSLWAMFPDGGQSEEIYGNNIGTPAVFNQPKQVPGRSHQVVCLGAGHCPGNMGAILLVDLHKDKRTPAAMTALTPGCIPKGNWALRQWRNGRWIADIYGPWYCDPMPLSDSADVEAAAGKFFLVSCNPEGAWNDPAGYGIYLLDVFGNRVPVYADPAISCFQARPLEPRPTPARLADSEKESEGRVAEQATVMVANVYRGLDGVAPGTVKYLRVMEQVPRPWSVYRGYRPDDSSPGQMVAVSLYTHLSVKVLHGVVPVDEDGSAYFTVPANRNIFFQALDRDFMEVQRMRTFVDFQPGERRSCVGCHEQRSQAPLGRPLAALLRPPQSPQPQPGDAGPRPIHYPTDVQPIFDRHCAACHNAKKADGGLDLGGEMTALFSRSYESIINKDLVGYIQEFVGPKPEGADAMGYAPAVPPYTYGSHKSRLVTVLRQGHYGVKLPREDFIRLVTWVDANAPYYGSYFGRRNLAYRNQCDFRLVPTLDSALGIPPAAVGKQR